MSHRAVAGGRVEAGGGWRSPRRAPLLAGAVVLAAGVSVGGHPAGAPLLPAMRHGAGLRARPCLQEHHGQMLQHQVLQPWTHGSH